eukprot:1147600-Amphidinium_carterae.1
MELLNLGALDSLLGPVSWPATYPGRPSERRTKTEQQQTLSRLAQPRKSPADDAQMEQMHAAKRSARAQREACDRLASCRKPRECEQEQAKE